MGERDFAALNERGVVEVEAAGASEVCGCGESFRFLRFQRMGRPQGNRRVRSAGGREVGVARSG